MQNRETANIYNTEVWVFDACLKIAFITHGMPKTGYIYHCVKHFFLFLKEDERLLQIPFQSHNRRQLIYNLNVCTFFHAFTLPIYKRFNLKGVSLPESKVPPIEVQQKTFPHYENVRASWP